MNLRADLRRGSGPVPGSPHLQRSDHSSRCRRSARVCGCPSGRARSRDASSRLRPSAAAPDAVKDVLEIVDADSFLPPAIVELCQWVADYYLAGIGDAMAVALPPGARDRALRLSDAPHGDVDASRPFGRGDAGCRISTPLTDKQREALAVLAAVTAPVPLSELKDRGITADVVGRLAARGLVALLEEAHDRDPFGTQPSRDVDAGPAAAVDGRSRPPRCNSSNRSRTSASSVSRCCMASPAAARPRSTCACAASLCDGQTGAHAGAGDRAHSFGWPRSSGRLRRSGRHSAQRAVGR